MEIMLYVQGQELLLEDIAESLVYATSKDIQAFKALLKAKMPRNVRMGALRKVLEAPLKTERDDAYRRIQDGGNTLRLTDSKRVERLKWFQDFSEYQLETELAVLNDEGLTRRYLTVLWLKMLKVALKKDVPQDQLEKFCDDAVINEEILPDIKVFNEEASCLFKDDEGMVDGLFMETFKEVMPYSSSVKELVQIGKKHGIKVPTNLKKGEVCVLIEDELKKRGLYDKKEHAPLKSYTLKQLEAFARDHDIIASGYVTKPQAVEYILRHYQINNEEDSKQIEAHKEVLEDLIKPLESTKQEEESNEVFIEAVAEKDVQVKETLETSRLEMKIDALTKAIIALKESFDQHSTKALSAPKRKKGRKVMMVFIVFMLMFSVYIGVSFRFNGYWLFEQINNVLNRIPIVYNYGLVDFFYRGIERFILRS